MERHRTTLLLAFLFQLLLIMNPTHSQLLQTGEYPAVASVATYKPVTADSVCGADGPEQYCKYTTSTSVSPSLGLLPTCIEATCDNTCPHSTSSPDPFRPAAVGTLGADVTRAQGREGEGDTAFQFESSSIEVAAGLVPTVGATDGFSFAAWINRDSGSSKG